MPDVLPTQHHLLIRSWVLSRVLGHVTCWRARCTGWIPETLQVLNIALIPAAEAEKAAKPAEEAEVEGWAQFGEAEAEAATQAAAAAAPAAPAQPALPAVTDKDVKDSLQLTEVWRAELVGGEVVRAGLEGGVRRRLAPYGLAAARFRLLPASASVVNACLRVAAMNRDFAEQLPSSSSSGNAEAEAGAAGSDFLAKFTQASVGCCYLQYR